jgi:hypothetical protein
LQELIVQNGLGAARVLGPGAASPLRVVLGTEKGKMKKEGKIGAHSTPHPSKSSRERCAGFVPIDAHPCRQLVTAPLIGLTPAARRSTGAGDDGVDEESWDRGTKGTAIWNGLTNGRRLQTPAGLHLQPRTNSMWHSATLISTSMLGLGLAPGCRNENGQPGAPNISPCRASAGAARRGRGRGSGLEELDGQRGQGCPEGGSGKVRSRHGLERGAEMNGTALKTCLLAKGPRVGLENTNGVLGFFRVDEEPESTWSASFPSPAPLFAVPSRPSPLHLIFDRMAGCSPDTRLISLALQHRRRAPADC